MKNPATQLLHCWRTWRQLHKQIHFTPKDATQQIHRTILPARITYKLAGIKLKQQTHITQIDQNTHKIQIPSHNLHFYWHGPINNNLYYLIEQELNPNNPHHYTTPPIQLNPQTRILDIGACEGLFALTTLKKNLAQHITCFEPHKTMANLIQRTTQENNLTQHITIENTATSNHTGPIQLTNTHTPETTTIQPCNPKTQKPHSHATRIDDYLSQKKITLKPTDLIKIDAEGQDLATLQGASQTISQHQPQIAVTTYHADHHTLAIHQHLKKLNPNYHYRLKGFSHWTPKPRPILLQATTLPPP